MPINTRHPDYEQYSPTWRRNRTAFAGQRAVKDAGEDFLPRLPGQKKHTSDGDKAYAAFKDSALFLGMTRRTVEGLKGAATWKPGKIELPQQLTELVQRQDLRFAIQDVLLVGRSSILVEIDQAGDFVLRLYPAERVVNWRGENGAWEYIVIDVSHLEQDPDDRYGQIMVERYLELSMVDGRYQQQVWRRVENKRGGKEEFELEGKPIFPIRKGQPLDFIPFVIYGHTGLGATPEEPPISEVVDCNVSHYQVDALHKQALAKSALVQPYITGWDGTDGQGNSVESLQFGGSSAWIFPQPESVVGLVEPQGGAFEAYEREKQALEQRAAAMGARLLENQKRAAETAETTRLRSSADQSVLAALVDAVEEAFIEAALMAARWAGANEEACVVQLSRDFLNVQATPDEMRAWMQQVQAGLMSFERYAHLCNQGEVWMDGRTVAEELEAINGDLARLRSQSSGPTGASDLASRLLATAQVRQPTTGAATEGVRR